MPGRNRLPLALLAGVLLAACDGGGGGTGLGDPARYTVVPLGTLAGATGQPEPFFPDAVNNAGQVAGTTPSSAIGLWSGGAAVRVARTGAAQDLNEAGTLVGRDALSGAFVATSAALQVLSGTGVRSWATGINDAGRVVGYGTQTSGVRAFLWSGGTLTLLEHASFPNSFAAAINETGQVAGAGLRQLCTSVPEGALCAD
ncbi:MAG TPA: hypothetical protein VFX98_09010, partial [Longimicrobiaceae bacterium]|nr:hypothetical protein [Longimicrobiaceae bacterium]